MGRKPNDMKILLMGECLRAGLNVAEASEMLNVPLSTAKIYSWAYTRPTAYRAWREREKKRARERAAERRAGRGLPPRRPGFWTEERLAHLKEMRDAGRSFAQCAEKLGCTRNMVAGATNRRRWTSPLHPPLENLGIGV